MFLAGFLRFSGSRDCLLNYRLLHEGLQSSQQRIGGSFMLSFCIQHFSFAAGGPKRLWIYNRCQRHSGQASANRNLSPIFRTS